MNRFSILCKWVTSAIDSSKSGNLDTLRLLIDWMCESLVIGNYFSASAIHTGICGSLSIHDMLDKSLDPPWKKKFLKAESDIILWNDSVTFSELSCSSQYRCIPPLRVLFSCLDLLAEEKDMVGNLINFQKCRSVASFLSDLKRLQSNRPNCDTSSTIQMWLQDLEKYTLPPLHNLAKLVDQFSDVCLSCVEIMCNNEKNLISVTANLKVRIFKVKYFNLLGN
jgi:hypothetical protein